MNKNIYIKLFKIFLKSEKEIFDVGFFKSVLISSLIDGSIF